MTSLADELLEGELGFHFFDSNVLIADTVSGHPHHDASSKLLSNLLPVRGAIAAHSLAEAYNNLTRRRRGYDLPPVQVKEVIEHASRTYSVVTLTALETVAALAKAADMALVGPVIYDALIVACARKVKATAIYTYNGDDFRRVAPDLASIIHEP